MISLDWMCWLQMAIGVVIGIGGLCLALFTVDGERTPGGTKWSVIGLVGWAAWFVASPLSGHGHDSPPALAMAGLVAYVLVRHSRQLHDIVDGAWWWPPNQAGITCIAQSPRRKVHWALKLNPISALFGNADDGLWGDAKWRASRGGRRTLWEAWVWWTRNPAHNLTWYVIGVADRDRIVCGRHGDAFHPPGGGPLICWTRVTVMGLPVCLPFVSYLSVHVKAYAGWRPSGAFGLKLNISARGEPSWLAS